MYFKILILAIIIFLPLPLSAQNFLEIKANNTIIDQKQRTIIVQKPFKRIISLYGAHTENLFNLGLDNQIIGVSRNEVFPDKAKKKKIFSYHDDPEKFLAANPDLVLIRPMIDNGYPKLIQRLEQNNITVVSLQPASIDQMYCYWEILGILTGKLKQAKDMKTSFNTLLNEFQKRAQKIKNPKRVYFEAMHSRMRTFAPDSIAIFALETAGGINVAKNAKPRRGTNIAVYGKERILSKAQEIDAYLAQSGVMNRVNEDIIKNEPGFQVIKAIKDNQIYIIDEFIVSRPSKRILLGIYEIGRFLYPDVFEKDLFKMIDI